MTISYAITCSTETEELRRLLKQLSAIRSSDNEIIIQIDQNNHNQEVVDLAKYYAGDKVIFFPLNNDFASFKNNLLEHCTKEYIFFIDADEYLGEFIVEALKTILDLNVDIECFSIPRVNTVKNITYGHIKKWGWSLDIENRINWPDYQTRICKNNKNIRWVNKVHERLEGYKTISAFPDVNEWALQHHKTIERQEKQNEFYSYL